ncbi:motility associated factor glycosyltransferase family protein [Pelosinus propionicus]|uniref:Uncharacterized conserved protein n=1 Tax=Pelosinus propionicus DSM 13327 TaxID=1123291 RepID=A0A1I4HUP3_9FIRM|nr:6-hydroxymethylpterin diphosphokinase MptE-like protein [Pelosinus propionicus]SFL45166.1 Uncharacterized conserved protein [Pelosinus propionicus DSM 13327]
MKNKTDVFSDIQLNNWKEKNWSCYRKKYANSTITAQTVPHDSAIELLPSRTEYPTLRVVGKNGQTVFLHSSVDPIKEAQRLASNVEVQVGDLIVVYGLGLGYLVETLLKQFDERISFFVIEPDQNIFQMAMGVRSLCDIFLSPRVFIHVGNSLVGMQNDFFTFYDATRFHDIVLAGLSGHKTVYNQFYSESMAIIKQTVNSTVMELETIAKIGPEIVSGTILNFVDYCTHPGVDSLFGKFSGVPAIIVAAGPSLNNNIELLREAKGRAVILAVGTAAQPLQKQDIVPDFIVSIDPISFNYEHFKEYNSQETALITDIQSYPAILQTFLGPMFVATNHSFIHNWFEGAIESKGDLETGGTAAHSAMVAAYKMGADPIIFIGQDLAFANDGRTHASGTNYGEAGTNKNTYSAGDNVELFPVKANDGGQVLTNRIFSQFRLFIEKWIETKNNCTYINATEGGALIAGAQIRTLREVLSAYCNKLVDVRSVINQTQQEFCRMPIEQVLAILYRRLADANHIFDAVASVLKRLKQLQLAYESKNVNKIQKYSNSINETFQAFEKDTYIRPAVDILAHHIIHHVLFRRNEAMYSEDNDVQKAIADYKVYYGKIYESVERVRDLIEQSIKFAEEKKHE